MARIYLSPLVVDIRAKQGDTVFSKWRGVNYIRSRVDPSNPRTTSQQAVRNALARLVALWQDLHASAKMNRAYLASGKSYSGYNYFMSDNIVDEKNGNTIILTQTTSMNGLTSLTATGGANPGEIDVSWSPDASPTSAVYVYCRKVGTSVWAYKSKFTLGNSLTISGLESGASYEIYAYVFDNSYTYSAISDGQYVSISSAAQAIAT